MVRRIGTLSVLLVFGCALAQDYAYGDDLHTEDEGDRPAIAVADFAGPLDTMRRTITATFTADLSLSEQLRLVDREHIMEELKRSQIDVVDESTAPKLGKLIAAQKVVVGEYTMMGGVVSISARLIDVETGIVQMGTLIEGDRADVYGLVHQLANRFHRRLTGNWLPAAVLADVGPSSILAWLERIDPTILLERQDGEIQVTLNVDKGARSTYFLEQTMQLSVEVDRECYVYIYNVDVRQRVSLVFPNAFEHDNHLRGGKVYHMPQANARWDLAVVEEPGEEKMIAIATEVPLEQTEVAEGDITTYSGSLQEFVAKAVKARSKIGGGENVWGVDVVTFFTAPEPHPKQ